MGAKKRNNRRHLKLGDVDILVTLDHADGPGDHSVGRVADKDEPSEEGQDGCHKDDGTNNVCRLEQALVPLGVLDIGLARLEEEAHEEKHQQHDNGEGCVLEGPEGTLKCASKVLKEANKKRGSRTCLTVAPSSYSS